MVALSDILKAEGVVPYFKATSKKQILYELALRAAHTYGVNERILFEALVQRERLGTTIAAPGVALPHTKLAGIDDYIAIFMRLQEPVIFDDYGEWKVDLLLMLLVPDKGGAEHLRLLASCVHIFSDKDLCEKLRHARAQTSDILQLLGIHDVKNTKKTYAQYKL